MSFKGKPVSRKDRIASRFIGQVHTMLARAAVEVGQEQRLTRADVAKMMDVNKSVITRILSGKSNLTIRTIGELAGALGYRPTLKLEKIAERPGTNYAPITVRGPVTMVRAQTSTRGYVQTIFAPDQK